MYEIALKRGVGTCKCRCQLSAGDKQHRSEQYLSNNSMILDLLIVSTRLQSFALHVGISGASMDLSSEAHKIYRSIFHVKIPSVSSVC